MKSQSHFSKHALIRITQRSKLSTFELANMLEDRRYVLLGSKPGMTKQHLLIYSAVDLEYFVVIQDDIDGTIVTVLPTEYHENLAWAVTEEQKDKARELATIKIECKSVAPSSFIISAGYLAEDGTLKIKKLGKLPTRIYGDDIEHLIESHFDRFELLQMTQKHGVDYDKVEWFSIKLGCHGILKSFLPPRE